MSPSNGHHMMAGLFMPNGVDPMCHGNYVGDATACECEDATKDDGLTAPRRRCSATELSPRRRSSPKANA